MKTRPVRSGICSTEKSGLGGKIWEKILPIVREKMLIALAEVKLGPRGVSMRGVGYPHDKIRALYEDVWCGLLAKPAWIFEKSALWGSTVMCYFDTEPAKIYWTGMAGVPFYLYIVITHEIRGGTRLIPAYLRLSCPDPWLDCSDSRIRLKTPYSTRCLWPIAVSSYA
jgi:hypothetical protein